jgi:hypothetical protein
MLTGAFLLPVVAQTARDRSTTQAPPTQSATMNQHQMMTEMQASQKRLDDMVAQMNAATGPDRVDRMAAVINEMAAMHKRMSTMMMQGGMMQMMHNGAPAPAEPGTSPDDHSAHHP